MKTSSLFLFLFLTLFPFILFAATTVPFTINMLEPVNITGSPRIALDVGGVTRYATYTSGSGTSALTFTYTMIAGDVDLDGVALSSPLELNGGTIKDLNGNDATLTFTPPNTPNVKVNYPSLGMDFVYDVDGRYTLNGTVYNDLSSFLTAAGGTFTRASTATYFNSSGTMQTAASGVPRFDYDPNTHVAKGILIEESRTNLLTNSATFQPFGGGPVYGTYVADVTAPDGSSSGSRVTVASSREFIEYVVPNANYTFSFYVKLASGSRAMTIDIKDRNSDTVRGTTNFTATTSWQRVAVSGTTAGGSAGVRIELYGYAIGDHYWGAQLEQGSFPTSYIPTTTAAATRASDTLAIPSGGWYDSTQGAFYAEAYYNSSNFRRVVGSNAGGTNYIGYGGSASTIETYGGGTGNVASFSPAADINTYGRYGMAWSNTSSQKALVGNGGTVSTVAYDGTFSGYNGFRVGNSVSADFINAPVRKIKYYPSKVTNTQLQALTQ